MNTNKNEIFTFNSEVNNEQALKTYIECIVKYNTLDWFLYYEDFFFEHSNTNKLDLSTSMETISIDSNSTQSDIDKAFMYYKACHLGVEYIEHALKLLLILEGYNIKELKTAKIGHDLKKHFELIKDSQVKSMLVGSIGHYNEEFLNNILNGIPTNIEYPSWSDQKQKMFESKLEKDENIIKKIMAGIELTDDEYTYYLHMEEARQKYTKTKFDKPALIGNKYFVRILSLLSDSFVDLRYPEVSNKCDQYNLDIILSICKSLRLMLTKKMETAKISDSMGQNIEEFIKKVDAGQIENYTIDETSTIVPDRLLTPFEEKKLISSNKAKYNAIFYYMYGSEQFYLSGKEEYWASLGDLLQRTNLLREKVNGKSNDKSIYENYLYYQACHLASEYIEHSFKVLLLNNGYTYKEIKEKYSHDFKSMYNALNNDSKKEIENVVTYFNEDYLAKTIASNSSFRDVIKLKPEEKKKIGDLWKWGDLKVKEQFESEALTYEEKKFLQEYEKQNLNPEIIEEHGIIYEREAQDKKDKYFEQILNQISGAFKMTRYPDFYNYNLDYKYCLKILLAFAETLHSEIEQKKEIAKGK